MRKREPEEHLEVVRRRILASAKALFVQQGYKKTTIRQIVEKSGVLTGSIYYLYKNKADIFQALVLSLLRQCVDLINERFGNETPAFKYALMCMIEIKAVEINELARESYFEGYSSNAIFEKMVGHVTLITEEMFAGCPGRLSHEAYYARTLLIKGAMRSCVAQFYFDAPLDLPGLCKTLLQTALDLLEVPAEETANVMQRLQTMDEVLQEMAVCMIRQSGEGIA